jgi:hypothetical protein
MDTVTERSRVLRGLRTMLPLALTLCLVAPTLGGCRESPAGSRPPAVDAAVAAGEPAAAPRAPRRRLERVVVDPFIEELQERTFRFFWETANPVNGLVPDRWPTKSFSSVAAVGFGLTAYTIGVEHGWITREEAIERVLTTLRFFWTAPQGPEPAGRTGHKGFFYHFLDMDTGARFETVELSTIDTTLFLAGALTCEAYFDRDTPAEVEIRQLAASLYERVEWRFFLVRPPRVNMGWKPENGFSVSDWWGYDEAMILYVLALGSPTHAIDPEAWPTYTSSYRWGSRYGMEHAGFAPLFGHQFSHVWIDFRGIQDAYLRPRGIDYFENTRRATLEQRQYAIENPGKFTAYGADVWGLSACDGPADVTLPWAGRQVRFMTYAARGASFTEVRDDGTVAPYAAGSSLPFTPAESTAALKAMNERWGEHAYSTYGFLDSFNPTFTFAVPVYHGKVVPGAGWFDTDYLGIDQGPLLAMIENHRSGLVWNLLRRHDAVVRGLRRAGFTGGWLDATP